MNNLMVQQPGSDYHSRFMAEMEADRARYREERARWNERWEADMANLRRLSAKREAMNDELHAALLGSLGAPRSRAILPVEPAPPTLAERAAVALVQEVSGLREDLMQITQFTEGKRAQRRQDLARLERDIVKGPRKIKGRYNGKKIDVEVVE